MVDARNALDELRKVMKRERREKNKGAWTAERLSSAKAEVKKAMAEYKVVSAQDRLHLQSREESDELIECDSAAAAEVALFHQFVNLKRLEWAKKRREAIIKPAGHEDDDDDDSDDVIDIVEESLLNELAATGRKEEKKRREATQAGQNSAVESRPGPSSVPTVPAKGVRATAHASGGQAIRWNESTSPRRDNTPPRQRDRTPSPRRKRDNGWVPSQIHRVDSHPYHGVSRVGVRATWRKMLPCLACGDPRHAATKCNPFRELRLLARKAIVTVSGACPNCIRIGHGAAECGQLNGLAYARGCPRCHGELHNSLLCPITN